MVHPAAGGNNGHVADVDFFFDPVCPWAWITSRWVTEVAEQRSLEVDWRFIALRMINGDDFYAKARPGYEEGHMLGLRLLRVAAAIRDDAGIAPVADYYTVIGRAIHVEEGRDELNGVEGIAKVLASLDLSPDLAEAADDEAWDLPVRADTDEALARVGKDVGTPIITFGAPGGPSFFGPVISRVPRGREAVDLWDAVVAVAKVPGFAELKRSLRERPQTDS
jgi:2-hydroxychromene-2-carboxylate isomerase